MTANRGQGWFCGGGGGGAADLEGLGEGGVDVARNGDEVFVELDGEAEGDGGGADDGGGGG